MAQIMPNGACHLCGTFGPLTFEHIPPSSAFNNRRLLEADIHKLMRSDLLEDLRNPKGNISQRGSGKHTLCVRCNNDTGGWYGGAYVDEVYLDILTFILRANKVPVGSRELKSDPETLKQITIAEPG
jgi:5-methylcytosine-specific restriction endonuclease McrA